MTDDTANRFVTNARGQWEQLVSVARTTPPRSRTQVAKTLAEAAGVGKSTLARKLEALHMAMNAGLTDEELVERGQRWVMAKFVTDKRKERDDAQVVLKWSVNPQTRDDAHALFWRIGKILGRRTSEELWDFLIAVFADTSDAEILHLAGEPSAEKRSQSER